MTGHDPLTCPACSPEPHISTELTVKGRTRRWTGAAAFAVVYGPVAVFCFALGCTVGMLVAVLVQR